MLTAISHFSPRIGIVVAAFLFFALPLTLTASPIPLASSSYYYTLNANNVTSGTTNTVSVYNSITSLSEDVSWASTTPPAAWSQAVLSLYTILSITPAAHIEISAVTSGAAAFASASGTISVSYSARIEQLAAPPVHTPRLPVRFRGVGFGSASGPGGWSATIAITYPAFHRTWSASGAQTALEVDEVLWVAPNDMLAIGLNAVCTSNAVGGADSYCSADVDPIMFFDQEAWDALLGTNTFLLDDFFALKSSANLVPEPALWPLAACALAGILVRRRRD
ncbi:MAG: hypothetical protein JNK48_04745 [Bryobacterales bacterium]|nr:hypothetical protein [Bryobacterales bacterium]